MKCSEWKTGASLCFNHRMDEEEFAALKAGGVDCVELSFGFEDYFGKFAITKDPISYRLMAEKAGIELWSIHLPFSGRMDLSHVGERKVYTDRTMMCHKALVSAASVMGVKVAVVHPSSEPIADDERTARLMQSRDSLRELAAFCKSLGMRLAVENLPRTCLLRSIEETRWMLDQVPDVSLVFDTNHLLGQDNTDFVNAVGDRIITLHVSDYDFVDERHLLPFKGKNNWKSIVRALENAGYTGPWMYEVGSKGELTAKDLADNHAAVAAL